MHTPVVPPPSSLMVPLSTPSSFVMTETAPPPKGSLCTCGRCCATTGCTTGVATTCLAIGTGAAGVAIQNPILIYISLGMGAASTVIQTIQGVVNCCLLPRKALEDNVQAVGKASDRVDAEKADLKEMVQKLKTDLASRDGLLGNERQITEILKTERIELDKTNKTLQQESEQLRGELAQAKAIIAQWEKVKAQIQKQLSLFRPEAIERSVDGLSDQLQKLSLTKETLAKQVSSLGTEAADIEAMGEHLGQMFLQFQTTAQGLANGTTLAQKQLDEAKGAIADLTSQVEKLKTDITAVSNECEEYKKTAAELRAMVAELQKLSETLNNPAAQELLKSLMETTTPSQ